MLGTLQAVEDPKIFGLSHEQNQSSWVSLKKVTHLKIPVEATLLSCVPKVGK